MLFDTLAMCVVSLIFSLFISSTCIHGYPSSSSSYSPSADVSSSLRLFKHRPVPSVDNDISEMFINDDESSFDDVLPTFHKRSSRPQFNFKSLSDASAAAAFDNKNQLNEPVRLSSSLKTLVETNPFARAWLTMLLQKLMQEQHVPYIFKYGRR